MSKLRDLASSLLSWLRHATSHHVPDFDWDRVDWDLFPMSKIPDHVLSDEVYRRGIRVP